MQIKDIMTKKSYKGKDGSDKALWQKVGTLKTNDSGKQFVELAMFPDTQFFVFEQKKKEDEFEKAPF